MDKSLDEQKLEQIIKHMWTHAHVSNLGFDTLTDELKKTFNLIVGKQIGDRNV
jgi:hypothetical protein